MEDRARKIKEALLSSDDSMLQSFDNKMQMDDIAKGFDSKIQADSAAQGFDDLMNSSDKTKLISELAPESPQQASKAIDFKQELMKRRLSDRNLAQGPLSQREWDRIKLNDKLHGNKVRLAQEVKASQQLLSPDQVKSQIANIDASNPSILADKAQYADDIARDVRYSQDEIQALIRNAAKQNAWKSKLIGGAKGLARMAPDLLKGAAVGMALEPTELANAELPSDSEGMKSLASEMRMKNAPYNYPTRFSNVRKKLGLE